MTPVDTFFAPAARADADTLVSQRAGFLGTSVGSAMLEAMPGPAMVLNSDRQILAVNGRLADLLHIDDIMAILGQRPGEAVRCVHAQETVGGCGTAEACVECGAVGAVLETLATRRRSMHECRLMTVEPSGGALDLRVHASVLTIDDEDYVIVGFEDIANEKRRQVLERAFFHDLLNTCGGVQGLADLLVDMNDEPVVEAQCKRDLAQLSRTVVEEIQAHRQMFAAERGELVVEPEPLDLGAFLQDLAVLYRHHVVAQSRHLVVKPTAPVHLVTDGNLLRRSVGNLIKNAFEATPAGGTVELAGTVGNGQVKISVHNPGVIPPSIQRQIFQRSFSTKGGAGRGVGTYAVRLFVERYLAGKVSFVSDEAQGTVFQVFLPLLPVISA